MGGPGSGRDPVDATREIERHQHDNRAATKHGLWIGEGRDGAALMACKCCPCRDDCEAHDEEAKCALEIAYTQDRRQQLAEALEASGHDPSLHGALITNALVAELRLGRAMRAIGQHGELIPGTEDSGYLEYQPVAREVPRLQGAVEKALVALDLTPRALREVRGSDRGPSLADLLRAAAAEEDRSEPVDAEFAAEDEGKDTP